MNAREILIYFSMKYDYDHVVAALRNKEPIEGFATEDAITIVDPSYPEIFKHVPNPPIVIWATDELDNKYNHCTKSKDSKRLYKILTGEDFDYDKLQGSL